MDILCIEDQEGKFNHIKGVLQPYDVTLIWKSTSQAGLLELLNRRYDILLLDMSMPVEESEFNKENFDSYAGMYIFREIKRKKYNIPVILVTGFDDFEQGDTIITLSELEKEILNRYGDFYRGCVKYDSASVEWQRDLIRMLNLN